MTPSDDQLAGTIREESGRLVAALYRRFGDFDVAEEAVQGAVVEALASWRRDGTPDRPGAWLATAAQRNAMDLLRSRGRRERATRLLAETPPRERGDDVPATDDRLSLLFACCHPALAPEARLPLTLRAVIGLTTPQIARAFLVNEQALAQRIVRAKRKIVSTGIDLRVPDRLEERLPDVLAVIYVMYNEAFVSSTGRTHDRDLGADAVWLAGVVATSLPEQAEAWGLAALLTIQHGRAAARFSPSGQLILLRDQDRGLWDRAHSSRPPTTSSTPPHSAPPAATSSRPRSPRVMPRPVLEGDGLAPDRHVVRRPARAGPVSRGPPQRVDRARPARAAAGRPRAGRGRGAGGRGFMATTCGTRPTPSCSGSTAAMPRRTPRTSRP